MKEMIGWLKGIEGMACDLYGDAAAFFEADRTLSDFLNLLAEDEALHFHVMGSAAEYLRDSEKMPAANITLDRKRKERIEGSFQDYKKKLMAGDFKSVQMIECVVNMEFSEWNDILLYVVNTLKDQSREFRYVPSRIQQHRNQIEKFVADLSYGRDYLEKIRKLPSLWREKILIVDDHSPLVELLAAILSGEGQVDTAENGKEGLKKTDKQYYDVIISDINMPVMTGIEFYKKASERDPDIGGRFLFLTGEPMSEYSGFFEQNKLRHLSKPARLDEIERSVADILKRPSREISTFSDHGKAE